MKIHSNITGELLHIVHRLSDFSESRTDIVPSNEFLQCASIRLYGGQAFQAHKHIEAEKVTNIAQESWIIVKGKVKAMFYDIDDTILQEVELLAGDCSVTLKGGHNYVALEPSLVYEYKTGPYLGQKLDKVFI